jgi:ribosomal protein S18 acetylase RimI-like enzyme
VQVRRVRPEEWEALRALRVRALEDSPDAFGSTALEARGRSDEDWITWARAGSSSSASAVFVAEDSGTLVGLCGAFLHEHDPSVAQIVAMWINADYRGRKIGEKLLAAAADWSAHRGADQLVLDVTETNEPAIRLYRRAGFSETGRSEPLRSNPGLLSLRMSRLLGERD